MRENQEIISIIKKLMKEQNISSNELARKVGKSKSSMSRYLNETRDFPVNDVNKFAAALDTTAEYLLGFEEDNDITEIYKKLEKPRQTKVYNYAKRQLDEQNYKPTILCKEVGLYGAVSAGFGQMVYDNPIEYVSIPIEEIPESDYDIMLKVVGNSMEPAFKDGEYIFVKKTPDVRSGQFVVTIIDGEAYLKKLYIEDNYIKLVSLNPDYDDIIVNNHELLDVIGVVVL